MAEYTQNYNFEKQQNSDFISIDGINGNFVIIDDEIKKVNDKKVDVAAGKVLSSNDFTTVEKNKLAGIGENANNYTHPSTHPASIIAQDATNRFVTDTEKSTWNGKQNVLGYTPVQQGTGSGQLSNTVKIGWSGARVKVTVDNTDMGNVVFDGNLPSTLPANGGNSDTVDGIHIQAQTTIPSTLTSNVLCIVYE